MISERKQELNSYKLAPRHPSHFCAPPLVISSQQEHNPAAAASHASALFLRPKFYFKSCYVTSGEVSGGKKTDFAGGKKEVFFG